MITEFKYEYRWLSNFAPVEINYQGIIYPSVEHAYVSAKAHDMIWKRFCADKTKTPGQIKREGRKILIREDWEEVKLQVMKTCLIEKYKQEPYKSLLIETKDTHIQEGNSWNDTFWGVCLKTGEGENNLGNLLMQIRKELCKI